VQECGSSAGKTNDEDRTVDVFASDFWIALAIFNQSESISEQGDGALLGDDLTDEAELRFVAIGVEQNLERFEEGIVAEIFEACATAGDVENRANFKPTDRDPSAAEHPPDGVGGVDQP